MDEENKSADPVSDSSPIVGHIRENFTNLKHQDYMMKEDG